MARKKIEDGGQPNRPKDVIEAAKALQQANRDFRTAHGLGARGRLGPGVCFVAGALSVADGYQVEADGTIVPVETPADTTPDEPATE